MVSAHQTMRRRGAFRAGLKALGMRPAEVDRFCQRMPAAPEAPHPRLAALLRETHGMMLYEEDLMASIAAMTGSSLEAADDMRAEIVRADNAAILAGLERDFVAASVQNGVTASEALAVWLVLARFAAYSFNKAHAASYAELAWQSAYLKTHYPVEFAAAVLNSYGGHYPLRTVAGEFARCGVRLLAPHVNFSETACTPEAGAVRVGLRAVKRLTAKSRRLILDRGPFNTLADLLARVVISHRELEALVLCGACDALAPLAEELYPFAHQDVLERLREERSAGVLEGFVSRRAVGARAQAYRSLVRIRNELRFLEMHLTDHPMHVLRDEATRVGCITTAELAARRGEKVRIAGLVAAARRLVTRGGRIMQFVTLEDEHGLVETVLFPDVYASLQDPVTTPGPFIVGGRVEDDNGEVQLRVSEVIPFYLRPRPE